MLNVIKSKMNFGKDDFCIKVEFGWKDVLKNDFWFSFNVSHEYYSNIFNLAVIYYNLGSSILLSDEETKLKQAIKYLQYSAWLFDNIKNEIPSIIPVKETPPDMSSNYLTYVIKNFNFSTPTFVWLKLSAFYLLLLKRKSLL
jgi:hypothetical protein